MELKNSYFEYIKIFHERNFSLFYNLTPLTKKSSRPPIISNLRENALMFIRSLTSTLESWEKNSEQTHGGIHF